MRGEPADSTGSAALRAVSSDFFAVLSIPVKRGRTLELTDKAGAANVVVINEAMERQAFGTRSPLGQFVDVTPPGSDQAAPFQVVGIVGDAREKELLGPTTPIMYFSDQQVSFPHSVLIVRTADRFPADGVRQALRTLDPTLALDDVGLLSDRVRWSYALQSFLLTVLGAFAVGGILLVSVGVYGAVAFHVASERRATGVRIALGATPRVVLRSIVGRTARLAGIGCIAGALVARFLPGVFDVTGVFDVDTANSALLPGVGGLMLIALLAAAIPARRGSMVDPIVVLRES